jgi:hypothetical protein
MSFGKDGLHFNWVIGCLSQTHGVLFWAIRFHMQSAPLECEMYFAWPNCSGMHDAYLLGDVNQEC